MLASIYRHDIKSDLTIIHSGLQHEDTDVLGISELEPDEREELEEIFSSLQEVHSKLDEGRPLEAAEEEFAEIAEYKGQFSGDVGRSIDEIAELSTYVNRYLGEFNSEVEEQMRIGDLVTPLEEHDVQVRYNGNRDAKVHGDPGLCLVANTVAENGVRHGKEDESYQMWAEIEEESDGYEIDIWDNGPGIPEQYDPEQILQKGTGNGTGKGLNYASRIVDLFDGDLYHPEELQEKENGYGLRIELKKPEEA